MKNNLRNLFYLSLSLFGLIFTSCEKDLYEEAVASKKKDFTVKHHTFRKLLREKKFENVYRKTDAHFRKGKTSTKTTLPSGSFTIDSTVVNEVRAEGYTSYTMLVMLDGVLYDTTFIDNLIMEVDSLGNTTSHIVRYDLLEETNSFTGNEGAPLSSAKVIKLRGVYTFSNTNPDSGMDPDLETGGGPICVIVLKCNTGEPLHNPYGPYCNPFPVLQCTSFPYSGGGSGGGLPYNTENTGGPAGYGSGGSGENSGYNNNPITVPVLHGELEAEDEKTPCITLKALSKRTEQNIDSSINVLKQKVREDVAKEWGVDFKRVYTPSTETTVCSNEIVEGTENNVPLAIGTDYVGGAHLHTCYGHEMFSFGDVYSLYEAYKECTYRTNKPYVTFILVCNNPSNPQEPLVYAIKVDNFIQLETTVTDKLRDPKYTAPSEQARIKRIIAEQGKIFDAANGELEKSFLQQFNNIGVSLYKANSDLSNWSKLELLNGTVAPNPCN